MQVLKQPILLPKTLPKTLLKKMANILDSDQTPPSGILRRLSPTSADSRRAVDSYWQKYVIKYWLTAWKSKTAQVKDE